MGDMLKATAKLGRFIALGRHNPPVQLVHVDDVSVACFNALGKSGIFDIASEQTMPLKEMFSEAARLGGKTPSPLKLPEGLTLGLVRLLWKTGLSPVPPLYLKMFGYDITRDISLTGLRGLIAPPAAILAYYGLQRLWPGTEPWALLLPVALIASGAWQFTLLRPSRETASEAA